MASKIVFLNFLLLAITLGKQPHLLNACDVLFEGFGIHLGSIDHFAVSRPKMVPLVIHRIYNDLGIRCDFFYQNSFVSQRNRNYKTNVSHRHFRTSYESAFSPNRDTYEIVCDSNGRICSWIDLHNEISRYRDFSIMASVWSPPRYMINVTDNTLPEYEERNFHNFIGNITSLMKTTFNITVERVSPINEPENVFAAWEHIRMVSKKISFRNFFPKIIFCFPFASQSAHQLCRMVDDFNDSLITVCPECSYFATSLNFATLSTPRCLESCEIFGTHAYSLTIANNTFRAYYDLVPRVRNIPNSIPIWQTEVCSTYDSAADNQMREALDMAINIANFVGHTCIQRYYYWYSYTLNPSGESLIWGQTNGRLTLPKKYFAYKHFTLAAHGGSKLVTKYDPLNGVTYLRFGDSKVVFVNNQSSAVVSNWTNAVNCWTDTFYCTTNLFDWHNSRESITILPAESVCSCRNF